MDGNAAVLLEKVAVSMAKVENYLALLLKKGMVKEWYTTKEFAEIVGRKEFTVREWCRLGRIAAKKLTGGRGNEGEWRIPHSELIRHQNEGLLPLPPEARWR